MSSDDDALPEPPAVGQRHAVLWGGRSSDGSPIGTAVAEPLPLPMIDKPEPPGAPPGLAESIPGPVKTPGTFMAAWSSPAQTKMRKTQRAQRRRKWAIRLCMLVALAVGAYFAYPYVHTQLVARSVASDLRPYVKGGGVAYAPPAEGYSVRLPKPPALSAPEISARTFARPMAARSAVVVGSDYRIAIWDGSLLGGTLPKGPLGALRDPKIGGTGTLTVVHSMQIGGETAYVGTFTSSDALPRRVAVLVHGGRLFVIRAQAESAGTVFDTVVHSFRFVPAS